jgi:hypothetical protein
METKEMEKEEEKEIKQLEDINGVKIKGEKGEYIVKREIQKEKIEMKLELKVTKDNEENVYWLDYIYAFVTNKKIRLDIFIMQSQIFEIALSYKELKIGFGENEDDGFDFYVQNVRDLKTVLEKADQFIKEKIEEYLLYYQFRAKGKVKEHFEKWLTNEVKSELNNLVKEI